MTQASNSGAGERRSDPEQIDLIDLVMQLWRGKMTIIASVVIILILAIVYLFVAKEKWTSTAILAEPDAAQVATYTNALKVLNPVLPGTNSTGINVLDVQNSVGGRFGGALSALSNVLDNQEEPEKLAVEPVIKGRDFPIQVTYVAPSAQEAQQKLTAYLQQVDRHIADTLHTNLSDNIKLQVTALESSLKTQETVAEEQRDARLSQIKEALKYAEEAKITKPQVQQTQYVTQDTMFLLGSDGLKAMIENESTRPLVFSDSYYQTKNNLLDIKHLNIDAKTIQTFRYVMKPDLPVRRDSPKRAIVLVLAVLLGGMIGAGIVLGRNALREYRSRS
ncbi:MAG: LPS O-antigen chain length determinant protein WzzB [Kluyvera sp.]|uniref:LPS O-antigen chain length determinant protein WzzB n=1 Tax=Kluyvera sp. TaxID=1538228 RepID=UPI003A87C867